MQTGSLISCFVLLVSMVLARACPQPEALLYYVPEEAGWDSLQVNARQISILAPQVFAVDAAGQVTGAVEERVRLLAMQHGLRLMPLLVNENFSPEIAHRVLSDPQFRRQVIAESVRLCQQNGCWGLQLDFERVLAEDKENYTQFVREAALAFQGIQLRFSVAVPSPLWEDAQPPGPTQPSFGGYAVVPVPYDLPEIAQQVDFLTLMTYDQHSRETAPGPVAGYRWVEQSVRYALQFVPPQKLSLGMAFYARHWCNDVVSETSYREAARLARDRGIPLNWHPLHRTPWFEFDGSGCRQVAWLENRRSLREKLKLVRQYRLLGFSAWRLGQEDPAFWE